MSLEEVLGSLYDHPESVKITIEEPVNKCKDCRYIDFDNRVSIDNKIHFRCENGFVNARDEPPAYVLKDRVSCCFFQPKAEQELCSLCGK
jgi:hypothetical protein